MVLFTVGAAGFCWNVIVTSSVFAAQGGLLIVQRNVYVDPIVPVNVLVGLDGVVMFPPKPDTILQAPVPVAGEFPANVVDVRPHIAGPVWSAPALAAVGSGLTVTVAVPVIALEQVGEV